GKNESLRPEAFTTATRSAGAGPIKRNHPPGTGARRSCFPHRNSWCRPVRRILLDGPARCRNSPAFAAAARRRLFSAAGPPHPLVLASPALVCTVRLWQHSVHSAWSYSLSFGDATSHCGASRASLSQSSRPCGRLERALVFSDFSFSLYD